MKKVITTDEYLQSLALMHMLKEANKELTRCGEAIEKIFETSEDTEPDIWDYTYEDDTPSKALGGWIKDNDVVVTGVDRSG